MNRTVKLLLPTLTLSLLGSMSVMTHADEVKIPVSHQAPELQDTPRPANGMSMSSVEAKYGQPLSVSGPVGEPPITTWEYGLYTVYFEHSLVIHTVLKP